MKRLSRIILLVTFTLMFAIPSFAQDQLLNDEERFAELSASVEMQLKELEEKRLEDLENKGIKVLSMKVLSKEIKTDKTKDYSMLMKSSDEPIEVYADELEIIYKTSTGDLKQKVGRATKTYKLTNISVEYGVTANVQSTSTPWENWVSHKSTYFNWVTNQPLSEYGGIVKKAYTRTDSYGQNKATGKFVIAINKFEYPREFGDKLYGGNVPASWSGSEYVFCNDQGGNGVSQAQFEWEYHFYRVNDNVVYKESDVKGWGAIFGF